jgi:hypothetical protein
LISGKYLLNHRTKDITEELINKVNPRTDKIKIKGIRQMRTNSVVMEFDTRSDLQKFKDHPKLVSLKIEESSYDTI